MGGIVTNTIHENYEKFQGYPDLGTGTERVILENFKRFGCNTFFSVRETLKLILPAIRKQTILVMKTGGYWIRFGFATTLLSFLDLSHRALRICTSIISLARLVSQIGFSLNLDLMKPLTPVEDLVQTPGIYMTKDGVVYY